MRRRGTSSGIQVVPPKLWSVGLGMRSRLQVVSLWVYPLDETSKALQTGPDDSSMAGATAVNLEMSDLSTATHAR